MGADDEFTAFVRAHSRELLRAAWLLTGDWPAAEDLVQSALAKAWTRWSRLRRPEAALGYVRRVMFRTFLGWRRRRWIGEVPTELVPDRRVELDDFEAVDARGPVLDLVRRLPPGQRAVVVLRYFADLTEAATAEVLGCSVGNVKSQTSRALAALRAMPHVDASHDEELL